ncbi:MAG TPA: hypothetical protein VHL57_07755, partial [Flavobacteriales bacterium]|nr:hypothetical protein [Flavobacteriales bacterium]
MPPWPGIQVGKYMSVEQNKVTFAEPPADFDWAALEDDKKAISTDERLQMEKAYEDSLTSIAEKEVL